MKYEKPKEEVRERTTKNENETKKIENSNSTIMDSTTPPSSAPVLQPQNVPVVIPAIVDDDDSAIGLFVKGSTTPVRIHTLYHSPAYNPEDTAESVDSQSGYN